MKQKLRSGFRTSIGLFACFALTVPSQALAKEGVTSRTKAASPDLPSGRPTAKSAAKQHCMKVEALTGSRMLKNKCKSIAEWEALGYELKVDR